MKKIIFFAYVFGLLFLLTQNRDLFALTMAAAAYMVIEERIARK